MADIWLNVHGEGVDKLLATVKEIDKYISNWEKKGIVIKVEGSSFSDANRQLANMESRAGRVARNLQSIGSAMKNVGGLMQSAGNLFGGKFVNTAKTMVSAFATMGAYSAAQGTVQRYDTMRMFPKMMEHLGYSASSAEKAVKDLEDAVIGLPTGLDEIVASARQLIPLTGNLKKGVNLAIAANNAFLAGGSDAQSVNYGQRQIKDLLSKGKLRSQEWDSLFTALGSGLGVIAEQMGYSPKARKGGSNVSDQLAYAESRLKSLRNTQQRLAKEGGTAKAIQKNADAINVWQKEYDKLLKKQDKSLGSFRDALKTNKIDALDFLDALEKVGTGQGELAKRANDYKDTIQATARNIKNALQKLGAAGLESLDSVLIGRTGKNLPQTIVQISDAIKKNLIPALEDWISDHGDQIAGFLDTLKNYNWGELVGNVGKGLAQYYKLLAGFFTKISPKFIAFMSVWAGPMGRAIAAFGSAMTTISGIIRLFSAGRAAKGAATAAEAVDDVAKIGFSLTNAFKGVALGAGIIGDIALVGGVIAEYGKIVEMISNLDIGPNFGKNMKSVGALLGGSTAITGLITGFFTAFAEFAPVIAAGEGLAAGFVAIVGEVGGVIDEYVNIVAKVGSMKIPSQQKWDSLGASVKSVASMLKDVPKLPGRKTKTMRDLSESMGYVADIAEQLQKVKAAGSLGNVGDRVSTIMDVVDQLLKDSYDRADRKDAKQTAEVLKQTSESVGYIGDIVNVLSDSKAKIAKIVRKNKKGEVYTNLGVRIGKVVHSLLAMFDKQHLNFGTKGKKNIDDNLKYVSKAVDSVGKIADVLATSKGNIAKLIRKDKDKHAYTNIGVRIGKIIRSLLGAFDDSRLGLRTSERVRQMDNMERIAEITRNVSRSAKFLVRAMKNINKLQIDSQGLMHTGGSPFEQMMGNMATMIPAIAKVYDEIPEIDEGNASRAETLANALSQFPAIVKSLAEIKKPIKELGVKRDDWTLGARLSTMMNGLTNAFGGVAESDFSSLQSNAASLKTAINSIKNTFVTLSGIQAIVNTQFTFTNGTWDLGMKLAKIMGTLAGAFSVTPTLGGTNVGSMATVAPQLQAIGEALGTIASNASSAGKGLDSAASGLKKLGDAAKNHTKNISSVAAATKQLQGAVKGIGGNGLLAAVGVNSLGSAASSQIRAISDAAGAAARLAAAIQAIPSSKTVSINVTGNGRSGKIGGGSGRNEIEKARGAWAGGLIYRAFGGSIFRPRGTDTVPAMLTPGEYVQRRRAVNYFGKAFMDRINSLDVDGALRSLSIRAGARARQGSYVTNNYRDNHAQVNFTVNRASQGYSQRVASRWARSLT